MKKIRLMLAVLACLIGTLCHEASAATRTVYFVNGANWTTPTVYMWKDGSGHNAEFPGENLSIKLEGKIKAGDVTYDDVYVVTIADDKKYDKIIFSRRDKGAQTADLTLNDSSLYHVKVVDDNVNVTEYKKGTFDIVLPEPTYPELYVRGTFTNGWSAQDAYKLERNGDVYSRTFTSLPGGQLFKIGSGEASYWKYSYSSGNQNMEANKEYECKSRDDMSLGAELKDVTVKFDYKKETLIFEVKSEPIIPTPTYPDLYLIGSFSGTGGWSFEDAQPAKSTNGKYTWSKVNFKPGNEWKISEKGWGNTEYSAGAKQNDPPALEIDYNKEYQCNVKNPGESTGLGNMKIKTAADNATVTLDVTTTPPTISVTVEGGVVEHPNRIYMSFGRDRLYDGNRLKAPRVQLLPTRVFAESVPADDRNHGVKLTTNDFNNAKEMVKAEVNGVAAEESPLWYVDLTDAEIATTKDLVFFFEPREGFNNSSTDANYWQYIASRSANWDFANWTKFIYFADNEKAAQSYMTFAQYEAACAADKEELYCVGNGFEGLNGWSVVPSGDIPDRVEDLTNAACMILKASNGVFYQTLVKKESALEFSVPSDGTWTDEVEGKKGVYGANFKMSWIRPVTWYILSGKSGGAMDTQRAWATFNLGIVGYDRNHPAITGGLIPVVRGTANALNAEVYCSPCRTLPMNNYNQANWFVRQRFMDNNYTLVIDVHDGTDANDGDCMTVTLLPFAPQPTLSDVAVEVQTVTLSPDQAEQAYANSDRLNAEAGSGKVLFTKVNKAVATATIQIAAGTKYEGDISLPDGSNQHYKFTPVYEFYSDSERVGTFEGTPGKITIDGIAYGNSSTLGIRTRYTDATSYDGKDASGLSFHTRYSESVVNTTLELPQPGVEEVKALYSPGSSNTIDDPDLTKRGYTLGAYAEVKVTAPDASALAAIGSDVIWYADFKLEADGASHHDEHPFHANGGEVVHSTHPAKSMLPDMKYVDYNPWAEGTTYGDEHNWSAKLAGTDVWPVHLPDVVEVHREYKYGNNWQFYEAEPTVSVKGTVRAVYPFVVDTNSSISLVPATPVASAPLRRADAAATAEPNYKLILKPSGDSPVSFSLNGGSLTAVRDLIAPAPDAEGETEYYNLQGVRMSGELAPGVYVRRQGARAEKVVIR